MESKGKNTQPLSERKATLKYLEENGIKYVQKTGAMMMPVSKVQREAVQKSGSKTDKDE